MKPLNRGQLGQRQFPNADRGRVGKVVVSLAPFSVTAIHPLSRQVVTWFVVAESADHAMFRCDLAGMIALSARPVTVKGSQDPPASGAAPPAGPAA